MAQAILASTLYTPRVQCVRNYMFLVD